MASIKFEEQVKKTLEQRKIIPSSDSWNALAKKLDNSEKKKNKTAIWWKAIAAIFIGVLFSLPLFFNSKENIIKPVIVDVNEKPALKLEKPVVIKNKEEQILTALEKPIKKEVNSVQKSNFRKEVNQPVASKEIYATIKGTDNVNSKHTAENLNFKIEEITKEVVHVKQVEVVKKPDIDTEVMLLLEAAKKAVAIQQNKNNFRKSIDADALLWSVENNIDLSLKDKILIAVKSGCKTISVAYEKRNN
jgi:hypothetical protein